MSGALRHWERALLVGEHTFGKGSVQNPFQLETRAGERFDAEGLNIPFPQRDVHLHQVKD